MTSEKNTLITQSSQHPTWSPSLRPPFCWTFALMTFFCSKTPPGFRQDPTPLIYAKSFCLSLLLFSYASPIAPSSYWVFPYPCKYAEIASMLKKRSTLPISLSIVLHFPDSSTVKLLKQLSALDLSIFFLTFILSLILFNQILPLLLPISRANDLHLPRPPTMVAC